MIYHVDHKPGCTCKVTEDLTFTFRGQEHTLRMPWCYSGRLGHTFGTSYRDVAEAIGKHLGYAIAADTSGHSVVYDLEAFGPSLRHIMDVVNSVPPLVKTQNSRYWVKRDLLYALLRAGVGRLPRCKQCGKREHHDGDFTYLMQCGRYLKIGRAKNPHQRLSDIQTSNPYEVTLLGQLCGGNRESVLHREFAHLRTRREWFKFSPDILKAFSL